MRSQTHYGHGNTRKYTEEFNRQNPRQTRGLMSGLLHSVYFRVLLWPIAFCP